jgi:SAM-dependent methyltransferase
VTELRERTSRYFGGLLGNDTPGEAQRLRVLAESCDPHTAEHLTRLGLGPGWRCLEVGAGAGTIARLMADRVGPTGSVVATDLNTEPMGEAGVPNLAVLQHDVVVDPCPGAPFDLIHCRFVLEHLRDRDAVLSRLASWLAPGGWLLVESALAMSGQSNRPAQTRFSQVILAFMERISDLDLSWGRELPPRLEAAGLVEVTAQVRCPTVRAGTATAALHRMSYELMRGPAVAAGVLTDEEFDAALRNYDDPAFIDYSPMMIAAAGRRPLPPPTGP